MTDIGVDAHLDLVRLSTGVSVRAFVAAAPPRPLRWRLVTESRSAGGASNVSQSGTTEGGSDDPVSVTVVSPNSRGTVVLTVHDGEREVAREEVDLAAAPTPVAP